MTPTVRHRRPDDDVPYPRHAAEVASLLLLMAVGFIVFAFAVHACVVR